ncbi:MAG: family 10 glycosylhydrolase [Planctomycetia bacterium]|nr:family 10 glycosylhydrolase [Planctomycetia bacterium]
MFLNVLFCLCFGVVPVADENGVTVLDDFGSASLSAWRNTGGGAMKLEAVENDLVVRSTFREYPTSERISIDRTVDWDLSDWNRFELDINVTNPAAFRNSSLYFHTQGGWFSAGGHVPEKSGTLVFLKRHFRSEGKPEGWGRIDTVRLSFWKGSDQEGAIRFQEFRAIQEPVLFVTTRNNEGLEFWRAKNNASYLSSVLLRVGLLADSQCFESDDSEETWARSLEPRQVIVAAYTPYMPERMKRFLQKYQEKTGKTVLFIQQDLEKETLDEQAFLESVATSEGMRKKVMEKASANLTMAAGVTLPNAAALEAAAKKVFAEKGLLPGLEFCQKTHDANLKKLALETRNSKTLQFKAWWNHNGRGAYPGDWPRTARELKAAGFTAVIPNLLWAACAGYPSDLIPRGKRYGEEDLLQACVDACHAEGLEVHVWKVNFNMQYDLTPELREKYHREGRLQKNALGEEFPWLCPSHPDNYALEWKSMVEMAVKYPIDGVHFDYIRYPSGDTCYCEGCRERFEKATGKKVADWPKDVISGELLDAYREWRCDQITAIVKRTREELRKVRPDCKVSAAVFSSYPSCKVSNGQDWVKWVREGYVDFLCPMNYTTDADNYARISIRQRELVGDAFPLYPGIAEYRTTPDGVIEQIREADRNGFPGFTIFDLTNKSAQSILPLLTK